MGPKLRDALKVFLVSTAWCEFPPEGYGGIETVIWNIILGSKRAGLNIKFGAFSLRDTARHPAVIKLGIKTWYLFNKGLYEKHITDSDNKPYIESSQALAAYFRLKQLLERQGVDLIHDHTHTGFSTIAAAMQDRPPILMTLHGPLAGEFVTAYFELLKNVEGIYFNSISNSQQKGIDLPFVGTVHNGIDTKMFPYQRKKFSPPYLFHIGRITRDKGQDKTIEVARALGMNLVIAGSVEKTLEAQEYWKEQIKPRIDVPANEHRDPLHSTILELRNGGPKVIYLGQADLEQKVVLFGGATVSLMPIMWDEPFGLVVPEAMACGTPVVAFNRGAMPEIIKHGETGFLVNDVREMVAAVKKIDEISGRACRKRVEDYFSAESMARNYNRLYQEVLRLEEIRKSG